ncbi:hypothetical protein N0V86_004771 [Didymella sp. IMI 355093]|nr:hypothetical protein N0V86_004771 [Didymella sp. IMI 355093]
MADASGPPRRVSMAYILGFSNKPFKDGGPPVAPPAPRHPNAFKQMVTTPGGVIEWAASDGRRGRLTGPGKPRLAAASLAQVAERKGPSAKTASKKAAEEDGGVFGGGLSDDAPAASAKTADDDKPADGKWTEEEDKKLLELRAANINGPWDDVANELCKKSYECKDRFKQIKPKDFKPNNVKGGGGGKQKNKKGQNQHGDEKKDDEKKDENGASSDNAWSGGGEDNGWGDNNNKSGSGGWDIGGDKKDSGGFTETGNGWDTGGGGGGRWDTSTGNQNSSGNGANIGWDTGGGDSGNNGPGGWDTNNSGEGDLGGNGGTNGWENPTDGDGWGAPPNDAPKDNNSKKASSHKGSSSNKDTKDPSNKALSHSGSKQHSSRGSEKASASAPKEYELKPDSTFSADDLRLIAKILQQDCSMVWNRVSWRFKDKTGRNLHPDVFEKKVTGGIKDRSSEHGKS